MNLSQNEKVSAYSHGLLIPIMAAGTIALIELAGKNIHLKLFLAVYGISAIMLFTASFLYHTKKKYENEKSVWRKLDRSAIFVLIAGTSTPMCFLYVERVMMWRILAAQWILVISGIAFSFFVNAPRKISTLIYISTGLFVLYPLISSIAVMPSSTLVLFITGSIFYITGAIVYAIKKPNPFLPVMGFHEVFHIFVIAGSVSHMFMLINGVTNYINT